MVKDLGACSGDDQIACSESIKKIKLKLRQKQTHKTDELTSYGKLSQNSQMLAVPLILMFFERKE